jgi:hypothetical protein
MAGQKVEADIELRGYHNHATAVGWGCNTVSGPP